MINAWLSRISLNLWNWKFLQSASILTPNLWTSTGTQGRGPQAMSPGHLYKSLRPEGKNKPGGRVGGALCGSKLEKRESCVDPFTSLPLACSNTSGFCEEGTHVDSSWKKCRFNTKKAYEKKLDNLKKSADPPCGGHQAAKAPGRGIDEKRRIVAYCLQVSLL